MIKIVILLFCVFAITYLVSGQSIHRITIESGAENPVKIASDESLTTKSEEINGKSDGAEILDFLGLVHRYEGYIAEEYDITTEDGYVLKLHRISSSPRSPEAFGKPVVYIQHGFLVSTDILVALGPNNSIAFQLAEAGYDVWMGNIRGNTYSRAHVKYNAYFSPDVRNFWDFRMDEMAAYDIPAFLGFVLTTTKQRDLTFIGFSQGSALLYMYLSLNPSYNDKINFIVNLGPAIFFLSPIHPKLEFHMIGVLIAFASSYEVMPRSKFTYQLVKNFCKGRGLCSTFISTYTDLDRIDFKAVAPYAPAGTSYFAMRHYYQLAHANGTFRKYDYGTCFLHNYIPGICEKDNLKVYGQDTPPEYDLSVVTVPNAIFYAENDIVCRKKDVQYLKTKLKNIVAVVKVADPLFNHADFVINKDVKSMVFNHVLEIIRNNVNLR